ncbi:hypothetical protein [Streptomyces lydicus]|uniref:hypothetical protein n=1 Tax=Streptomyces lydicus TaxID=47763 RepID=UPI00382A45D8
MAVVASNQAAQLQVRASVPGDEEAVLRLVAADRIAGQPQVTSEMLAEALAGQSLVDSGWWAELDAPHTDVAIDGAGNLVASSLMHPRLPMGRDCCCASCCDRERSPRWGRGGG